MAKHPIQRYFRLGGAGNGTYWHDAFGWVACFFAQLEWASYAVIDRLGSASDKARGVKLPYKARTELAAKLVDASIAPVDAALAGEWASFWQRAIDAAPIRNDILHNPLSVKLHGMTTIGDTEGIRLMTKPGTPLIELGEVQVFSEELRELNVLMLSLSSF